MSTLKLRNFWILWVTTMVLACFSNAVAQASYKVTDLGVLQNGGFGCAMSVNNHGWTEAQYGVLDPSGNLVEGRVGINVDGLKIDLGTLGGLNSFMWGYAGFNERGEAVGLAETAVPDPNGEDICGFGTGLTCRPFLWQKGHMRALPTLGGNNGWANAINNHGQIAGFAENTTVDSGCPPYRIELPVLWEKGKAQPLPTVGSDPDGVAYGINNQDQAVGYSGTCTAALHAVLWENGIASQLPDLGFPRSNIAFSINDQGQIVGQTRSSDGKTKYATLWQNGTMINLPLTLFPASSNLYATMAQAINDRGQISGMATVLSGPHAGEVHAFLATPVNASVGTSVAEVARTHPKITLPANVGKQLLQRFGPGRFER